MTTTEAIICDCGLPATTEVSCGWDRHANGGAGGGVYAPVCEACYAESLTAADATVDNSRQG